MLMGTMGKNRKERLSIVFFAGIVMALIGAFGLLESAMGFMGTEILNGMMAGVGIMLAKVGFDMSKSDYKVGISSMVTAIAVYFLTQNVIYTIVSSVVISSVIWNIANMKEKKVAAVNNSEVSLENEKISLTKPMVSSRVIRSTLALCALQIGGNIAYSGINGDLANSAVNVDHITLYSGVTNAVSGL